MLGKSKIATYSVAISVILRRMPKASATLSLSRQWQILRRMPHRSPGITAGELSDHLRHDCGFSLTKRTVERDLVELATLFPLTIHSETKPFRWLWAEGAKFDVFGIDLPDALALALAQQVVTPLLPAALLRPLQPRFALARSKLLSLSPNKLAAWMDKVRYVPAALELQSPRVQPEVLAQVQEALLQEHQMELRYTGPGDRKAKELRLHPLVFIQRGPVSYLAATAFDYTDIRLYALHRISRVHALDSTRQVPAGFDADAYLRSGALGFGGGEKFPLRAGLTKELAYYLAETPLGNDQELRPRGDGYELKVSVVDSWQLRFWILSQGSALAVLSPAKLRCSIRAELQSALAAYA